MMSNSEKWDLQIILSEACHERPADTYNKNDEIQTSF